MGRIFIAAVLIAAGLAVMGCGSLLGIQVYDQDAENSTNVGSSDSSTSDQSSQDSPPHDEAQTDATVVTDADATADRQDASAADGPSQDASDGLASKDAALVDSSPDAPPCTDACTAGSSRCSTDNGRIERCQLGTDGCTTWVASTTCGTHRTCAFAAGSPTCACRPSICTGTGNVCQDAQTVATCATDANSCLYVGSTTGCTAPESCSGQAPSAMCSLTCTSSCTQGQKSCVSGGLATCTLGSNGCDAYAAPAPCGTRQACTGAAGAAACTCNTDLVCASVGQACVSGSTLAGCAQDSQGCLYQASSSLCTGGKICQTATCLCASGLHDCSGTCSNNASTSSCGTTSCIPCSVPTNGQATCDAVSCGMSCGTGLTLCGAGASAACLNLQTDGSNCGACGHNCQNGGCRGGQCQPAPLATGFTAGAFAIGTDSIYVVDYGSGGRLLRIAKSSGMITPLASGNIFDTAVFGSSLYWTTSTFGGTDGRVTRAALDGTSPQNIATGQATASSLFVDASGVYWLVGNGATDGAVMRFGPTDSAPVPFASTLPRPNSIAGDSNNIYWLTIGAIGDGTDGAVYAMPKTGGIITLIAASQHNATGTGLSITAFGGTVYWDPRGLGGTDGAVRSAPPVASATATEYANSLVRPQGIAADGSFVYWIDAGNGTDGLLQKASLTTKVVTELAGSLANPGALGLDGSVLYFAIQGNSTTSGGLYRLIL